MMAVGVHKKLFGLFLASITVLTIMSVFIHLSIQDRKTYRWVTQTYEVQARLAATLFDVETGQDAHEDYCLHHNGEALAEFQSSFRKTSQDLDALGKLLTDNTLQTGRFRVLRTQITDYQAALEESAASLKPTLDLTASMKEFALLENIHRSADAMIQADQNTLEQRTRENRASQRRVNIALFCFLLVVSLLLISLFFTVRQDVAQQQRAERLRHANDQKMANILENTSDAFLELNHEWAITGLNGHAERLLHGLGGNLFGKNLFELQPGFIGRDFKAQCLHSIEEAVPVRFEAFDASRAEWYEVHAYPNDGGIGILLNSISERKKAEEERERASRQELLHSAAQQRNQELQDLARRLVELQEVERRHLAYELHEEIGQVLAGLKLSLAGILKQPEGAQENRIQAAQGLVTELMRQVRALALDLRPGVLDDLGLLPALNWYCEHYAEQAGIAVNFHAIGLESRLDGTVETTAYRIVQEALANVAHHSAVKSVAVRLHLENKRLILTISDCAREDSLSNVSCFCDQASLTSMQERTTLIGGTFEVAEAPGQGTTITANLPIHPQYTSLES